MKLLSALAAAGLGLTTALVGAAAHSATLDDVKKKGFVQCGVSQGLPGFSNPDDKGEWRGLDVDLCRAVAAAVLGDAKKVRFTPLSAKERFTALTSTEIDLLVRNTTWTMGRDTNAINFAGVNFYDGQGLMMHAKLYKELEARGEINFDGATICTNTGTTTELNITDYYKKKGWKALDLLSFEKADEVVQTYDSGRCQVYTTDRSALAANRLKMKDPKAHVILPEVLSKEPLGPVVRQGDDQWFDIVKWTHNAMLNAEELGVSSKNVKDLLKTGDKLDPQIKRLLGLEGNFGKNLGIENDWVANIVSQVGNYGEVFDRNVGPATPLKLDRGVNALWTKGGLQYAPPIR